MFGGHVSRVVNVPELLILKQVKYWDIIFKLLPETYVTQEDFFRR